MTSPRPNIVPLIALAGVTLLFAVTWSHDRPQERRSAACVFMAPTSAVARYPARTGLFTSGRAATRATMALRWEGSESRTAASVGDLPRASAANLAIEPSPPVTEQSADWLAELIHTTDERLTR